VKQLQDLHEEKFVSIGTQFRERDIRTEGTSRDTKTAVDAALQAAKEAAAKSEVNAIKQMDQIGVLITTMQSSLNEKVDDLRGRVQATESIKKGGSEVWGIVFGGISLLVAAAAVLVAVFSRR
jgi:hypothetical protein